ncbi:retrotransposon hot spot (RHS) protein, putative, partial [Trypanosoma cruzi]
MPGNQASAVPQGDRRRRARPETEDVTDQPAATHIRVEEARRPQWTMYSDVKDILLEGRTNMRLNEFIRSYLGEEWVVENGSVVMEAFVWRPTMFIQNQQLLELIFNLTAYQELKRELNEGKILLEAVYKLHHEGVHFLDQWKDHEGKYTVTPVARKKLNAAISHVMREERREAEEGREAEERARREAEERRKAEERARRRQK